jgi:hypothetical protein
MTPEARGIAEGVIKPRLARAMRNRRPEAEHYRRWRNELSRMEMRPFNKIVERCRGRLGRKNLRRL